MSSELLRKLPRVDDLLSSPDVAALIERLPREMVVDSVRHVLDDRRARLRSGTGDEGLVKAADIARDACDRVARRLAPNLNAVVNATGVVLHTNLGRAPLSRRVLDEAADVAEGYSNLEYDLGARRRGSRYTHSATLLRDLTGAEDSLVVNNNAAAMVLLLSTVASGREAIVSRGELIEIGGSFRLPDIFRTSGARLVEVGTTNRTHLRDYEQAIGDDTAMMLKVHRSNFEVVGFTSEVSGAELAELGRASGVPVCEDLGSGCLVDLRPYGLNTTTAREQVEMGLDLVTFSGDKLLGGPQAGVIVGRADLVQRIRKHPLTRAFRCDKFTLATLERTLLTYLDGSWRQELPALAMLTASVDVLEARAQRLHSLLAGALGDRAELSVVVSQGRVGGGALPQAELEGRAVRIRLREGSMVAVEAALRAGVPAIVARLSDDALVLDVRCILDSQLPAVVARLGATIAA